MSLAAALDRTRVRAGLGTRLARAAWTALAAGVAVELGVIAERGVAHAREVGFVAAGALGVAAALLLFLGRRPTRTEAARRLDRTLGCGSLVETAAEALEGRHGVFSALLVRDAEQALAASAKGELVPIRPPRALGAGVGVALLLLALALGPAAEAIPEDASSGAGVELGQDGAPGGEAQGKRRTRQVLAGSKGAAKTASKLDEATARKLGHQLDDLVKLLATRTDKAPAPGEERRQADLEKAIAKGDAAAVQAAIDALKTAGTAHSLSAVRKAADTLTGRRGGDEKTGGGAGAGAGGTPGGSGTSRRLPGEKGTDPGKDADKPEPWRVREAIERYRASLE